MEDVNYGAPPDYKVAGRVGDYGADRGDAARDGYGIKLGTQEDTNTPWIEGDLHSPLLTDNIENTSASQRKLDHEILFFLRAIHIPEPQIMRRFILACMEKNVNEKDLLWLYHMKDFPQNGTLPQKTFIEITKQQLTGNAQLTIHEDYEILADSYRGFGGDHIRYVTMCNHLYEWRVKFNHYKEFPLKQIYPPYRFPLNAEYPRPEQGEWQVDAPRREPHALPTINMDELIEVPGILRKMALAVVSHKKLRALENLLYQQEKLKEDKSVDVGIIPHDYVKRILQQEVPLALTKKEHEILSLYYEHPYILHFFRYRDFLHDLKYEMGEINPKFKEGPEETRLSAILATIKRYIFNNGVNVIEPLKDFDTFNEGRLNKSQMKRALHLLRIGYGLRCSIGEDDMEFLLNSYSTDGVFVDYKSFVTELMQVFVERFEPGGRLAMVLESFEPNLARGTFYPPRQPPLTREEVLKKPSSKPELLNHVLDRLKMMVAERRMYLEPVFKAFDPHHIRYVQRALNVPRILQLCTLPVSPDECDVIIERFSDPKGFRYMEFLQAIDTSYFAHRLPTYPVTIATMEKWKHRRAWYPEVIPQNPHQDYQGPEAAVEKCRKNIAINRLRVSDFFIDQDFHHRGTVTRKQFRRATALMRLGLTPIENLILEDRYAYPPDLMHIDFCKFVADMDLVYAPKDVAENPAAVPEKYQFEKVWDRAPISEGHVALAQEGFRKLAERMLELRVHILPYFQDFDPWRRGLVSPSRFRRIINDIGLDVLTEFEWKAVFQYFTKASQSLFDYQAFLTAVTGVEKMRSATAALDPRVVPPQTT